MFEKQHGGVLVAIPQLQRCAEHCGRHRRTGRRINCYGFGCSAISPLRYRKLSQTAWVCQPSRHGCSPSPAAVGRLEQLDRPLLTRRDVERLFGVSEVHRAQVIEEGRVRERALLCRQAARKFGDDTSERLAAALAGVTDPDSLALVGDWIIECATVAELVARVGDEGRLGDRS